jgi:hypothetical protein
LEDQIDVGLGDRGAYDKPARPAPLLFESRRTPPLHKWR